MDQSASASWLDLLMQAIASGLGRWFGEVMGQVVAAVGMLILTFLLWGLPWERLISKAGFTGKSYWFLLGLFYAPVVIGFAAALKMGETSALTVWIGTLVPITTYLGLLVLAFFPWSVHRKLRQLQSKS